MSRWVTCRMTSRLSWRLTCRVNSWMSCRVKTNALRGVAFSEALAAAVGSVSGEVLTAETRKATDWALAEANHQTMERALTDALI